MTNCGPTGYSILFTCSEMLWLKAWFAGQGLAPVDLTCLQQDGGDDLEVVVAGQGDEQVKEETLTVLKHLWTVVIHTWRETQPESMAQSLDTFR